MPNKYANSAIHISYKRQERECIDHKDKIVKIVNRNKQKSEKLFSRPLDNIDYYICMDNNKQLHNEMWDTAAIAKKLGNYIEFDFETNTFTDKHGKKIDIAGKKILAQTFAMTSLEQMEGLEEPHYRKLLSKIEQAGGINLCSLKDTTKIENWFDYVKTGRKYKVVTAKHLKNKVILKQLIKKFSVDDKLFVKTIYKDFHKLFDINDLTKSNNFFEKTLKEINENIKFLVCEPVKKIEDELGNLETRFIVINNEIISASRYTNAVTHKIENGIINYAKSVINGLKKQDFPNTYALDIFKIEDENGNAKYDVVELNPLIASGGYINTFVFKEIKETFKDNLDEAGVSVRGYLESRYIDLFKTLSTDKILDRIPQDYRGLVGRTYEGIMNESIINSITKGFKTTQQTKEEAEKCKTEQELEDERKTMLNDAIERMELMKSIFGDEYKNAMMGSKEEKLLKEAGIFEDDEEQDILNK